LEPANRFIRFATGSSDTYDAAYARPEKFVEETPVTGRATATTSDEPGLSMVDIGKSRAPLLIALAEDAKTIRAALGDNYRLSIGGLDQPVRWRVTGPLDLAIYFPYSSAAAQQ
jgi:hypothetical protein